MKGIILAGGAGTRLYPMTTVVTKQLLPVYDKPMIYYPLAHLMMLGIREVLIISKQEDLPHFKKLFAKGEHLGLNIQYKIQDCPNGIAEAFIIGEGFIGQEDVALILGDNVYYGDYRPFREAIEQFNQNKGRPQAKIFGYPIRNPEIYGVVEFDENYKVISVEEKPKTPKSHFAIPGFYLFDASVVQRAKQLRPSARGELEVTDLVKEYLKEQLLSAMPLGRGVAWLDMGSQESLLAASSFIAAIENRQGVKVACIEEIALNKGYITLAQFHKVIEQIPHGQYRQFLETIYKEKQ